MLDLEYAPALIVAASDAAHHGNEIFHPMYCKILFDVSLILPLLPYVLTYLFYSMLIQLEGV